VDQSLEPIFTVCVVVAFPRFNPYFSGSVTGTKEGNNARDN